MTEINRSTSSFYCIANALSCYFNNAFTNALSRYFGHYFTNARFTNSYSRSYKCSTTCRCHLRTDRVIGIHNSITTNNFHYRIICRISSCFGLSFVGIIKRITLFISSLSHFNRIGSLLSTKSPSDSGCCFIIFICSSPITNTLLTPFNILYSTYKSLNKTCNKYRSIIKKNFNDRLNNIVTYFLEVICNILNSIANNTAKAIGEFFFEPARSFGPDLSYETIGSITFIAKKKFLDRINNLIGEDIAKHSEECYTSENTGSDSYSFSDFGATKEGEYSTHSITNLTKNTTLLLTLFFRISKEVILNIYKGILCFLMVCRILISLCIIFFGFLFSFNSLYRIFSMNCFNSINSRISGHRKIRTRSRKQPSNI